MFRYFLFPPSCFSPEIPTVHISGHLVFPKLDDTVFLLFSLLFLKLSLLWDSKKAKKAKMPATTGNSLRLTAISSHDGRRELSFPSGSGVHTANQSINVTPPPYETRPKDLCMLGQRVLIGPHSLVFIVSL